MPASAPAIADAFDRQRKRNTYLAAAIGLIAMVAVGGILAFKGLQALGFGSQRAPTAMDAKGEVPNLGVLATPSAPAAPVLDRSQPPPVNMPPDVYEWLEHLRKTEEARVDLVTTQLSVAMTEFAKSQASGGMEALQSLITGIDDPDAELVPPTAGFSDKLGVLRTESRALIQSFDSKPPPAECLPIRDAYYKALSETTGMIGDIAGHVENADVSGLMKMKGTSKDIDTSALAADNLVSDICAKYQTRKWFSIKGDIGSGSMMGVPNF